MKAKNKAEYAVLVISKMLEYEREKEHPDNTTLISKNQLPDAEISPATKTRTLNDLQNAGLLEMRRKRWTLTQKGKKLL